MAQQTLRFRDICCYQGNDGQCFPETYWIGNNASVELLWLFSLVGAGYPVDEAAAGKWFYPS